MKRILVGIILAALMTIFAGCEVVQAAEKSETKKVVKKTTSVEMIDQIVKKNGNSIIPLNNQEVNVTKNENAKKAWTYGLQEKMGTWDGSSVAVEELTGVIRGSDQAYSEARLNAYSRTNTNTSFAVINTTNTRRPSFDVIPNRGSLMNSYCRATSFTMA